MLFAQIVVGPPGCGKTMYCNAMSQFMKAAGRKVCVVNLDPANDNIPYECGINITELIQLADIMEEFQLGPNGSLVFAVEFLEANLEWLKLKLDALDSDTYVIMDCPGQVELYSHHDSMRRMVDVMQHDWDMRLSAVNVVDVQYCTDISKWISVVLLSLSTMLHLELPHVNVLTKLDLLDSLDMGDLNIDFYADVVDLSNVFRESQSHNRFIKLNKAVCGVIDDFALVTFVGLDITKQQSVFRVMKAVDKSNGFVYKKLNREQLLESALKSEQ